MAIQKPKYTENEIWANNPPDPAFDVMEPHDGDPVDGTDTKKALGWTYGEKPPFNFVNWNNQHKDKMLVHLNQNGIVDWDPDTEYNLHAFVNYPPFDPANPSQERKIYVKTSAAVPDSGTPDADPNWEVDIDLTSANIVVQSGGALDGGKLVMTDTNGKIHQSLMSIGILQYRGGIDITQPAPLQNPDGSPLETGDIYTISNNPSGTYDSTFAPLTGTGNLGEGIIATVNAADPNNPQHSEVEWYRVGSGLNDNYLLRDGHLPMVDLSAQGGGSGRLILAHEDAIDNKEATPKQYTDNQYIWKSGGTNGVMTGDLTVNANITSTGSLTINDINTSGSINFSTSPNLSQIISDDSINISASGLTFNNNKVHTEIDALMNSSYDMETTPGAYTNLHLTTKGYADNQYIWKSGGANGVMTGDLTVNANITSTGSLTINDINTSGSINFSTSPNLSQIISDDSINISASGLTFNNNKVHTEIDALMNSSYDMETTPGAYTNLHLTTKGYVDGIINNLITWPKEQSEDAVANQTDFTITNSNTLTFDANKVNVYIDGKMLRRGLTYDYTIQSAGGGLSKVVLTTGATAGAWVFIQHT